MARVMNDVVAPVAEALAQAGNRGLLADPRGDFHGRQTGQLVAEPFEFVGHHLRLELRARQLPRRETARFLAIRDEFLRELRIAHDQYFDRTGLAERNRAGRLNSHEDLPADGELLAQKSAAIAHQLPRVTHQLPWNLQGSGHTRLSSVASPVRPQFAASFGPSP